MRTLGIVAHSAEGGALCFLTACRCGAEILGPHMHPEIVVSAIPMGLSMPSWYSDDYDEIGKYLGRGVRQVADSGADFFVCPDNTAHLVLERIAKDLPIPGLHIAEVVCTEIQSLGWKKVGLLGTTWTMTGSVYANSLEKQDLTRLVPGEEMRERLNTAIFDELCNGIFLPETISLFIQAIDELKAKGAECVILGCTEIPLIIDADNSPLPVLDSTRLLARYGVQTAISDESLQSREGWVIGFNGQ